MQSKQIEKIIGRAYGLERAAKDSDKDGVNNLMDCKPYNPNKQGIIHNLVNRYKENSAARRETREAEMEAYREEKKKEAVRIGKAKAKMEADKKIKYHKGGGFFGQLGRAVSDTGREFRKTRKPSKKQRSKSVKKFKKNRERYAPKEDYDFTSGNVFV